MEGAIININIKISTSRCVSIRNGLTIIINGIIINAIIIITIAIECAPACGTTQLSAEPARQHAHEIDNGPTIKIALKEARTQSQQSHLYINMNKKVYLQ